MNILCSFVISLCISVLTLCINAMKVLFLKSYLCVLLIYLCMSLMIRGRRYISPTFCDDKKGEKKYKHKNEIMGEKKCKMK